MKNDSVNYSLDDYDFSILRTKNSPVVTSLYKLQDGRVAFSSANNTIIIVSIDEYNNMTFAQVLNEHSQGVEYVSQLKNGKLISCSFDHSIKIWKCDKLRFCLEHSIEDAHDQPIHKVIPLSNERMAHVRIKAHEIYKKIVVFSRYVLKRAVYFLTQKEEGSVQSN